PAFGRHRPATNSKYSSSSGTPSRTDGRPAASTQVTRHGSATAMRAPHLHERRATTARRNVHEDHPHIKQISALLARPPRVDSVGYHGRTDPMKGVRIGSGL